MRSGQVDAELVNALLEGPFESPLWQTFLDRLRRMTGADYANMAFRPPGRGLDEMLFLLSGSSTSKMRQVYLDYSTAPVMHESLVEGRVYSLQELLRFDGGTQLQLYREVVRPKGITAIRQIRIVEPSGVNAWLTVARGGRDFPRGASAILSAIGPPLRGVLRHHVASERARFSATPAAEAIERLQFGWMMLDRTGRVLECDEQGARVLSHSRVLGSDSGGRLIARPPSLEREMFRALQHIADDPESRPRAITLSRDPWLDMLLVPNRRICLSSPHATPAVIAYVHGDNWNAADRREQLAELFALSPREARLAMAFCCGLTVAEAASKLGLTVLTARTYCKSIYAKTGARGMPDLVRIVMRSVLAFSPKTAKSWSAVPSGLDQGRFSMPE